MLLLRIYRLCDIINTHLFESKIDSSKLKKTRSARRAFFNCETLLLLLIWAKTLVVLGAEAFDHLLVSFEAITNKIYFLGAGCFRKIVLQTSLHPIHAFYIIGVLL